MDERDLVFLDASSALFYAMCVGTFLLGVFLVGSYFPSGALVDRRLEVAVPQTVFLLGPVFVALSLHILSIISVLKEGVLLPLLLSGDGKAAKEAATDGGGGELYLSVTALIGVIWWAVWRYQQLRVKGTPGLVTRFFLTLAIISVIGSVSLTVDRTNLMPIIVGSTIVVLLRRMVKHKLNSRFVLKVGGLAFALCISCFVLFAIVRGVNDSEEIVSNVVGYTIAAYNRLTALLSGQLRYTYGGKGLYLSGFLAFNNLFNRLIPFREMFGWPSMRDVWMSEFESVWRANLNGNYIWSGTFGYIYSDLGWLSPGFMFLYGLLYGWVWRSVRRGRAFGILLYPWCAFCVLFWFGTNLLLFTQGIVLLIVALVLSGYEFVMVRETVILV